MGGPGERRHHAAMSKATKRIMAAKQALARSLSSGVQRRAWRIVGFGLLTATCLVMVGLVQYLAAGAPEPSSVGAEMAIRGFSYVLVVPFAKSAGVVLPTFVAALLALAVLEATQFGAAIVTQIVMFIGWLAAMWGWLAGFAFVVGELSGGGTLAAIVLALVCVLVAAVIVEVLPLGADLRLQESIYRQNRIRDAFKALRAGWEKRSGTTIDLSRKRLNFGALVVASWYALTVVAAIVVAVMTAEAAGTVGAEWWALVLLCSLVPVLLLVGFQINALQLARLRPSDAAWFDPDGTVYVIRWVMFIGAAAFMLLFVGGAAALFIAMSIKNAPVSGGVGIMLPGLSSILVALW